MLYPPLLSPCTVTPVAASERGHSGRNDSRGDCGYQPPSGTRLAPLGGRQLEFAFEFPEFLYNAELVAFEMPGLADFVILHQVHCGLD